MKILTVNAGSSSLKFNAIELPEEKELISGYFEKIGQNDSFYTIKVNGQKTKTEALLPTHKEAISFLVEELFSNDIIKDLLEIKGIGHRVVHGGQKYNASTIVDDEVLSAIKDCIPLAPLHNPANVMGIESFMEAIPNAKHVAVFDTAFHQTMPIENFLYSSPLSWYKDHNIRKYGFHGTSHKYITGIMQEVLGKEEINMISCHIGSGASLCCIKDSKSFDTTMGFTPNAGITMSTRCGDIDYSVIPYYMEQTGKTLAEVDTILNKNSGLLGLSGKYSDNRDIEEAVANGDEDCIREYDIYIQKVVNYISQYYVKLNGNVDAIVFTAGAGENGREFRELIINKLNCLGIKIGENNNKIASYLDMKEGIISSEDSTVPVYVIPTNEELMIAKDTYSLIEE